jgi:hypothetical protein
MSEENQPERPNATALDVALWMQEQVNQKYLYHSSAYFQIIQILVMSSPTLKKVV